LRINDTQITDNSIPSLTRLKTLKAISLGGTHVTNEGAAKLQQALPGCQIFR
jgi:hypothetical protein